ncbi:glyoxylase-like metal-dependent hydrolase (beta-lactamase superfamily II) [Clostridium beijerinckii]|uniref:Beta-lactamase domain protein n=2 Tax=Clostridium beijerinckii TaxID=1520 RepID=A6LR94_CLOB8|nr:beta-lactamase domain protein [Clostridium beijerinckii NCIMB 8052]AIU01923.1 beta-lactamase domain-containing protein [Clostridium beijerinckii ATCC 35702]NOW88080.1 glyoxylase-like metal-dependent hydrolase (beta-lactamase superfamily II) [Clostridium beijerinckii]NRT25886.1 glyoxylase-like metal-dependent hydrolase (beta-lactamase superfamily II) [Clostridium beijerinckii]NRT66516.1 glyoxylase-like metal-dependent hydrolase (beta-lactamase superfamily II) [Clostridium beijerinckii]
MDTMYSINQLKVGSINNCTYIIINNDIKEAVIIDPAWDLEKIVANLNTNGVSLSSILLTHSHYDHTNLVEPLLKIFNCQVYMAKKEINYYGFRCKNLNPVNDSDKISIGKLKMDCVLTPGHTAGGMCFKLENKLFTGDTIFIRGCGICTCKGGDYNEMFESIKKIKEIAKKNVLIYPGHYFEGDLKYESEYLKRNIYFHINDKEVFKKVITLSSKKNDYAKYEQ